MRSFSRRKPALLHFLAALFLLSTILVGGMPAHPAQAAGERVAYVYGTDPTLTANAFSAMLAGRGISVDLYSDVEAALAVTDFSADQAIIIGDDADLPGGFLSSSHIYNSAKPVLAIGIWGSQFLTLINPIWVSAGGFNAMPAAYAAHVADPTAPIWSLPSQVSQINQTLSLYTQAVPVIAILNPAPIQKSERIVRFPDDPNHYSLMAGDAGGRCYAYWGYRGLPAVMTPSAVNLFLNMLFGDPCAAGTYAVNSALAANAPVMDGVLNYGEWSLTPNLLELDHGWVAVMNDNIRLYLLVDVLESTVDNTNPPPNEFWVSFDTNNDQLISPGLDVNYVVVSLQNLRQQTYVAPAQWDPTLHLTKSSMGRGFDCYTPDNTKVLNINTVMFDCSPHQLWEIAINLQEINATPGGTVHMGLTTVAPIPNFSDQMPNSFEVDFSNLISVHLASIPIPPHDPNANIAFANPPVEITQVVQDVNNTIPLVANKATAGRVSVISTGAISPQPVLEYLYGQIGGMDLPGSPLVQQIKAPLAVNRSNLSDTANFLLPASWIGVADVSFHAEASDFNGHNIASNPQQLVFQSKSRPVYWIIQENNGTADAPDLAAQASIDSYESYIKAVFPVPDVTFVQKPWTAIGALNGATLQNNVNAVAAYYNAISAAYWTAVMQNKPVPYALPDMIFGAGNIGGGLSDPTWGNGAGRAAAGGNATSGTGVVAHEFNHNLDRSSNGTWGRHVSDPATMNDGKGNTVPVNNPKWGCGAAGPDPSWPFNNDDTIHEVGFDTRLPWQNTSGTKTVVPASFPDLMSYCQSGLLPTKWISPYRYRAWLSSSSFPTLLSVGPVNSIYLTGSLNINGSGSLDPAFFAGGMPITPSATGAYRVELSVGSTITVTHAFNVIFQDIEGNSQNTVFFNFVLPDPGGVTTIRLLHGAQVLATLTQAGAPPSGAFTAPGAGALAGTVAVGWTLTPGSQPLAGVRQQLQFSADNGDTWIPVAFNLPGATTTYALDSNLLPKTSQGKLRLLVSDGLNNVAVISPNTFSVGNHAPLADIIAPLNDGFIPAGSQVYLQGQASDVDEASIPDSHFLWTLDGGDTLGVGANQQVVLPNGQHVVTLTVLDGDGATGTASVTVYVNVYRALLPVIWR